MTDQPTDTQRLTDDELSAVGCSRCGGDLVPEDNQGNTVARDKAKWLVCRSRTCGPTYYPPTHPPLSVMQSDIVRDRLLPELRAARALLADLRAEGCPNEVLSDGTVVCAYCDGPLVSDADAEPRYNHIPMDDGQPCLWLRLERA